MTGALPLCRAAWLGTIDYVTACCLQRSLALARATGGTADTLLLLEHPPVYTTGRHRAARNLRVPPPLLGAPLIQSDRGGDITFHGPGQLIAYPIIGLRQTGLGVAAYVRALEEVIIRTLAAYGLSGRREDKLTGVWVGNAKIAAIGVRVSRPGGADGNWVTSHGLALNVATDLSWFERIVPCGIPDRPVTSMAALMPDPPSLLDVADRLALQFGDIFRRRVRFVTPAEVLGEPAQALP